MKHIELFRTYKTDYADKQVEQEAAKIISENSANNNNVETYKNIFACIDLTSLNNTDTEAHICSLVEKVNNLSVKPNVAAICVYPAMVSVVKNTLTNYEVEIASVAAGFPAPQTFIEIKVAETAMAVMEGATEIDMVFPLDKFLEGKFEELSEEIMEIKASCREAKLKIILETGTLKTAENIAKATLLAIASGADFVKTSTGKTDTGATPEAVYVMCKVIKEFEQKNGTKIGIKVSGGVSTVESAIEYYTLVEKLLGKEYLNKKFFRVGASKLANEMLGVIEGGEGKYS